MGLKPAEDWQTAKEEFYKLTGEKKPREKFVKFFTTTHTGLHQLIEELADFDQLPNNKRTAPNFLKLKEKYAKAAHSYIDLLDKLIAEESKQTVHGVDLRDGQIVMQKFKTDMYRGLKMLKAKLSNYEALWEVQYKGYIESDEKAEKTDGGYVKGDEANLARIESVENNFEVRLKNGFARFKAASNAIKATPTVEVWNREFGSDGEAIRSLTTALRAYKTIKVELDKEHLPMSQERQMLYQLAQHWIAQLSPWGDGNKRKLDEGANVEAERASVSQAVKQCAAAFGITI